MTTGSKRSRLVIDLVVIIMGKYPVNWKSAELALATGANIRAVERALRHMVDAGLLEKRYHAYTLSTKLVQQFYGAQWYLKQLIDKDVMLAGKKEASA